VKEFVVISRCLRACRNKKRGYIFHFKGAFMGKSIKYIRVESQENINFYTGADYLLYLKLLDITEGIVNSRVIKSKKLDDVEW
jgi:hypothetical protein